VKNQQKNRTLSNVHIKEHPWGQVSDEEVSGTLSLTTTVHDLADKENQNTVVERATKKRPPGKLMFT